MEIDPNIECNRTIAREVQAAEAALEPLYASFSDEQKKFADALKIGPMGVM